MGLARRGCTARAALTVLWVGGDGRLPSSSAQGSGFSRWFGRLGTPFHAFHKKEPSLEYVKCEQTLKRGDRLHEYFLLFRAAD